MNAKVCIEVGSDGLLSNNGSCVKGVTDSLDVGNVEIAFKCTQTQLKAVRNYCALIAAGSTTTTVETAINALL